MPFAAFFVAVCLLLCIPDRTRKALLCLLLGAAAGLAAARHTNARLEQTLEKYAGQTVALTAEVESVSASYYPGIVDAVLRVERVNGRAAEFRVECDTLPVCEAGERVEGRFALEAPEPADRITLFADGVVLWAREPQAFARLGKSSTESIFSLSNPGILSKSLLITIANGTKLWQKGCGIEIPSILS